MNSALELAIEEFKEADLKNVSQRSGAILNKSGLDESSPYIEGIKIDYLNQEYSIRLPEVEISYIGKEPDKSGNYNRNNKEVSSREKIIILHYLNRSKGTPLSDKLIDFREIPGGNLYYSVFENRVHKPFLKVFGKRPSLLLEVSLSLKGTKADSGDSSVRILAFPKVPLTFIIYRGDEEFPPAGKVLFDSSVYDYLTTEDIVFVCEDAVGKLIDPKGHSDPVFNTGEESH